MVWYKDVGLLFVYVRQPLYLYLHPRTPENSSCPGHGTAKMDGSAAGKKEGKQDTEEYPKEGVHYAEEYP